MTFIDLLNAHERAEQRLAMSARIDRTWWRRLLRRPRLLPLAMAEQRRTRRALIDWMADHTGHGSPSIPDAIKQSLAHCTHGCVVYPTYIDTAHCSRHNLRQIFAQ